MFLLPATCPPSRKERAAYKLFVECNRRKRSAEFLYLPQWSSTTLRTRAPEPEVVPIEDDIDLLIRDIEIDILKAHCEIRMIDAILAFNQGLPFDSIFMKGLPSLL